MEAKRILIVDDDKDIRSLLSMHLKKSGYTVEQAVNGRSGLQQLEQFKPDLILLDLFMPVMDGFEMMIEVRKKFKRANLPIIVLSSQQEKKEWAKAIKKGANDFVPKPFDKTELLARIGTNLNVADLNNKLLIKSKELSEKNMVLENEKKLAAEIQRHILPKEFKFDAIEVEAFYKASMNLSGDFYDVFQVQDRIMFMVGDVSGHGTTSALIMFAAKSLLHSLGKVNKPISEIIAMVNQLLCEMLGDSGHHLTLVFGMFNQKTEQLTVISAGHIPFYYLRGSDIKSVTSTGIPVGFEPNESWQTIQRKFKKGDCMFIITDGLTDATDNYDTPYGKNRLMDTIRNYNSVRELVETASRDVMAYCNNEPNDDITVLAIQRI